MNDRSEEGLAEVLVEFAHTLGTDFSIQRILDHLVLRIVDILPVTGAGVMLMRERQELHFVAASNDAVMVIEGLQNELGEGPCLEAYRTGHPVAISDMRLDTRFPRFCARAGADGLAAVFTFPMRLDGERLGALDLYRATPGPLSATITKLNHRGLHDPLTGLPNRVLLEERLEQAVARARRSHHSAAVLFADLDGFKSVNDRFGHHVGDQLLCAVARRLSAVLRQGDTLARLGGDEFVVLCEDLLDSEHAEVVAQRLLTTFTAPFELPNQQIPVTASVGVAFSGPGQDIPDALLRDADFAMYQAKRSGGGRHQVMDPVARFAADRRNDLERDLKQAEERGQLCLLYQPIVDVRDNGVAAAEALLRWEHPERGMVLPDVIIPSAERTGLILAIGAWVLGQACRDLAGWQASVPGAVPQLAVNVSASQVMGPAFAETVRTALDDSGADPATLCLEVTESVFLADAPRALSVLREVKDLGVQLSLDDFGTGYSSLS